MKRTNLAVVAAIVLGVAAVGGCTAGGATKKHDGGSAGSGGSGGGSGGSGGGGSGGSGGAKDGGTDGPKEGGISTPDSGSGGGKTCLEIQTCANACMDAMCVADCVAMGSTTAQDQFNKLDMCINDNCPMPSMMCACDVQCTDTGACKKLNEDCVGMSPDPDCAKSCP